jgi:hypothetical protein
MKISVSKGKIATGLVAAIFVAGAVTVAAAKIHRHVTAPATKPHHTVFAAAQPEKTCWRYYGGPKGGMWPGPCP